MKLRTLKNYYTVFSVRDDGHYGVYNNDEDFLIEIIVKDGEVYVGDDLVKNIKDLDKKIKDFANNAEFPVRFFDPKFNNSYRSEAIIDYYLKGLGFSRSNYNYCYGARQEYRLGADLGELNSACERIFLSPEYDDTGGGSISVDCGDYNAMTWAYKDWHEAIRTLNGWLKPILLMDCVAFCKASSKVDSAECAKIDMTLLDMGNLTVKDYKATLISKMEEALKELKESYGK